jgi:hypothetical protein
MVEHQGLVVEKEGDAIAVPGQGVVVKTDQGRFATLGADGNWHGFVPTTQQRDILNGEGRELTEDEASVFDPLKAAAEAKDVDVAGSEAVAPTGAVDDFTPGGGMGPVGPVGADTSGEGNVGARSDRPETDIDPSLRPATKDELDAMGSAAPKRSGKA